MATDDPQILNVRLAAEELLVLYELATNPSAESPVADLVPDYSDQQLQLAREIALRTLLARGLIEPDDDDGGYTLSAPALGIVGASLLPDSSTFLASQTAKGEASQAEFVRYGDEIFLGHHENGEGLHEFQFFAGEDAYRQGIMVSLRLEADDKPACPAGELAAQAVHRSLEAARQGEREVVLTELRDSSLPSATADALAESLAAPFAIKAVTVVNRDNGEERELLFLQSDRALWSLEYPADESADDNVRVRPLTGEDARAKIMDLHASA